MTKRPLARLLLATFTAGTLFVPFTHHDEAPHLTPERLASIASTYRYADSIPERILERCVPRARLMSWISAPAPTGLGHHGRHAEPPHVDPPAHDPTPLPTASYSVTGTAGESYAFRLRLPGEA